MDGQGTLITTKGAIINNNRNLQLAAADAERVFCRLLGAHLTIWLDGFPTGEGGHIDGIRPSTWSQG